MRLVGIDPGSIKAGLGCIEIDARGRITYVTAETITAPASWPRCKRLATIAADIEAAITELAPDAAAFESQFAPRPGQRGGVQTALAIAGARHVAEVAAWRAGVRVFSEHAPSAVKAAVGAGGRGKKALVAALVTRLLGLAREPQADAADGLAIAITAARTPAQVRPAGKRGHA